MGKSDLLKDSMKSGLDGLLSSTKKSPQKKETTSVKTEKEPAVHCNFVIDKSVHTRMKFLAIEKNMSLREDRKSTRLNSSHASKSRMPSSA